MNFFIMVFIFLFLFLVLKASIGAFFALIVSGVVFIVIFLFNKYSATTGTIKSNMNVYFLNRSQGKSHNVALYEVVRSRPGINIDDLVMIGGKIDVFFMADTEKEELENLIYLIFCHENGIPPTEKWKKNMYQKMNYIYESLSSKYGIQDRKTKYKKILEEDEIINLIKEIINRYSFHRQGKYPHDIAIFNTINHLYPNAAQSGDIIARFECLNILVSSVGGFKEGPYGQQLKSFKGPYKDMVEEGQKLSQSRKGYEETKVIADCLRDSDFITRDLKLLIFTIYDYRYPVNPVAKIYEKRIKQINKDYDSLNIERDNI